MMSHNRPYRLLAVAALAFQVIPPLAFLTLADVFHGSPQSVPSSWERPLSLVVIGIFALASFGLGSLSAYKLMVHERLRYASPLIAFCCFPAMLAGAAYLHSLLVFLAWI